jgi:hypothetical protein
MIYDPDRQQPDRQSIYAEKVINWARNSLAMIATIEDPMKHKERACGACGLPIFHIQGRHSNKILIRHPRGGCSPDGYWQ